MANEYINKVIYGNQTLVDLTGDSVTPSDVLNGASFHDRSGAPQTGSLITHNVYDGLDSTSTSDALSANQGKVLNESIQSLSDAAVKISTSTTTAIDDLDKVPNFTMGYVRLKANVGPAIGDMNFTYIKPDVSWIIVSAQASGNIWSNTRSSGSWTGWKKITLTNI